MPRDDCRSGCATARLALHGAFSVLRHLCRRRPPREAWDVDVTVSLLQIATGLAGLRRVDA